MDSYKPSAPYMPDSPYATASSTTITGGGAAAPYNNYPPPAQTYHVAHECYSDNHNYPPPAQAYHVAHQSYSDSAPRPAPSYPAGPDHRPAQSYHVGHESYSASASPPYSSSPSYGGGGGGGGGGFYVYNPFPPGTDPEVIRSFQMVDRDHSGFVDDYELQQSLSSAYHRFSLGTIRLLMFLFKNPNETSLRLGPGEFAALWGCLGQWRAIYERYDRDRSGKINAGELREALYSLGYAVPPSVIELLISRYDDGSGRKAALDFDSFVECGMVIKGLTEKFKEKDPRYTGSATLSYDNFMSMVLPFLVIYE